MNTEEHWEDAVWRGRLKAYTPLQLVEVAQSSATDRTATLALEELDRKLIAMGCEPG